MKKKNKINIQDFAPPVPVFEKVNKKKKTDNRVLESDSNDSVDQIEKAAAEAERVKK